ncbi:MAG: FAD-dependent oxidoreductase [bacterium]|nr:FAD-dependent oxidoreductase [bacterium]
MKKRVIIVGGGFGGIATALSLAKQKNPNIQAVLISDKVHFEYQARLYRVVNGYCALEVCIPLGKIFKKYNIEIIEDFIESVDLGKRELVGNSGSRYFYDFVILAMGSQTTYLDIPGLKEFSFGFKSIQEALKLKSHLHKVVEECKDSIPEDKTKLAHLVVVGGGASGVELAGELAIYMRRLTKMHGLDYSFVTIDLIEAAPRLLPIVDEKVSNKITNHLRKLGVNIFVNRAVIKEEVEQVFLKDMQMKSATLIWTAGVKPNDLYGQIKGLNFDKRGKVIVDKHLRAKGHQNVFVIGDGASTTYSGMAQTAISEGKYAAEFIGGNLKKQTLESYQPKKPIYAIPVGSGWAAIAIGKLNIYGRLGWWLRRLADLRYFLSILSFIEALKVFRYGTKITESCPICSKEAK